MKPKWKLNEVVVDKKLENLWVVYNEYGDIQLFEVPQRSPETKGEQVDRTKFRAVKKSDYINLFDAYLAHELFHLEFDKTGGVK
jgi:hypothetical protein